MYQKYWKMHHMGWGFGEKGEGGGREVTHNGHTQKRCPKIPECPLLSFLYLVC